jgi:solute carrier family 25 (mitochondrial citrate transporter), member 1
MQLSRRAKLPGVKPPNFIQVGVGIVRKESFLALYKGLGGISPPFASRVYSQVLFVAC